MRAATAAIFVCFVLGCTNGKQGDLPDQQTPKHLSDDQPATPEEAERFVAEAAAERERLDRLEMRAQWRMLTDRTDETAEKYSEASRVAGARAEDLARQSAAFDGMSLSPELERKLSMLKRGLVLPSPSDPEKSAELGDITKLIGQNYSDATNCVDRSPCRKKRDLYDTIQESRDPAKLSAAWLAWREPARAIREPYQRMVELGNAGAQEFGFDNVAELWRSEYEMPPDEFAADMDRQWKQLEPLYGALHCHVRAKLVEAYGDQVVPEDGLIPAHLLGNMWAQYWTGIADLVSPDDAEEKRDWKQFLKDEDITPRQVVEMGEQFYISLGMSKLPAPFWERSMFAKPKDPERIVDCQGFAQPIDPAQGDVRIKVCVGELDDPLEVVYHELGHIYYYLAYVNQPYLFRDGANKAFHEAIGDAIQLSVTPAYLKQVGLIDKAPKASDDLAHLFKVALIKLPWVATALVVEQWRSQVFSGEIAEADYNAGWWKLREKYQGIAPPVKRSEQDFDPGMFYHISHNVPFAKYFVATILQFDFHRALCKEAGHKGSLSSCTIYGSTAAGDKLQKMLEMGRSQPWPDALDALTGGRQVDARAMLEYFAPVQEWLDEQNEGRVCGW